MTGTLRAMARRGRGRPATGTPTVTTDELLDTALTAFVERGYEGTSVRELARELGVSHNLIPQRVGTKEELWYAAVDRAFSALAGALADAATAHEGEDDVARLRALVERFVEANAARPSLLQLITQEAAAPGPRLDWARHMTATYQPAVVQRAYLVPNAHLEARLVRWAFPELPCHRMAVARATGQAVTEVAAPSAVA